MYKFYKLIGIGWKYTDTFNSTLDPKYHAYINWCKENNIGWKLVRTFDNKIMFTDKKTEYENEES
jgi:hypothetical protein